MLRILRNDFGATFALIALGVIWGLSLVVGVFGGIPGKRRAAPSPDTPWRAAGIAAVAGVVLLPVALVRIVGLRRLLAGGREVPGRVTEIWFDKDRGQVSYTYAVAGREHQNTNTVWKNDRTSGLQPGDPVTVVVDLGDPSRAVLADVFRG